VLLLLPMHSGDQRRREPRSPNPTEILGLDAAVIIARDLDSPPPIGRLLQGPSLPNDEGLVSAAGTLALALRPASCFYHPTVTANSTPSSVTLDRRPECRVGVRHDRNRAVLGPGLWTGLGWAWLGGHH
jgi:hypothetical protein